MTCSTDHRAALPRKENPGGEGRGFRKKERKLRFAGDSPLEEAVLSELVSVRRLRAKLGKYREVEQFWRPQATQGDQIQEPNQYVRARIPYASEQGILQP